MRYVAISVPSFVLRSKEKRTEVVKAAPIASVGVSIDGHPQWKQNLSPHFDFDFEPGIILRSVRKRRGGKWRSLLSIGFSRNRQRHYFNTFQEIDTDNRGSISRDDLERYATKNMLPTDYIDAFFAGIKGGESSLDGTVKFEQFLKFVSSKEKALQRAFGLFDVDGDGRIDAEDLEVSLTHVRVCCPKSGCTYRNRRSCIHDLVAKVDVNNDKKIEYWEFRKFFMLLPQQESLVEYWLNAKCSERCDVGGCVVIHDGDKYEGRRGKETNPWGHLFAGAFAGAVSRTATAPLETLRLGAMTGTIPSNLNPIQAARSVCEHQGWRSLYKGNFTNVLRSAPQKALDFFAFDAYKKLLGGKKGSDPGVLKTFAAAGMAGATSSFILYPLEVVRSRLTVDVTGKYKGVLDAIQKIGKTEGVHGLYRGVGPSVLAILPEAAIVYGLFDLSKKTYKQISGREPGLLPSLSFGVWAAFMGQVVAYPLETISRRMQVDGMKQSGKHLTFRTCLYNILQKEGVSGLYRGLGVASTRMIPMAILSFGTYELIRQLVQETEDALDRTKAENEYKHHHSHCKHSSSPTA